MLLTVRCLYDSMRSIEGILHRNEGLCLSKRLDLVPCQQKTVGAKLNIRVMSSACERTEFKNIQGMGEPARRALAAAGITHLEQLADVSESDLMRLHGMGPKAMRVLKTELSARNLSFKSP